MVERRGDGLTSKADIAMTQMMCAKERKEAQTESEARRLKRQPKKQRSKQGDGQASKLR